ncbi:MAG: hypothetical protein M3O22_01305 [Pseudomonadota bacterium]|nr:hypothetical protein [Pseudomonadota bacterium]
MLKNFGRAVFIITLLMPGLALAQTLPLTQPQIGEALRLYEIVGQKTKELFNDPAQKAQLSQGLTVAAQTSAMDGVAGQAMMQVQGMIIGQLREALSAALPPQVSMGINLLQQAMGMMGVDNPLDAADRAMMAQYMPEETAEIKIDYERSNLPPAIKDMMRAVEKSSFDLGTLSGAMNYIYAGHWQRTGHSPYLNAAEARQALPQDPSPRGLMALAVELAQISYSSGDEVLPPPPAQNVDALLAQAARDTAPYSAQIEQLIALMQSR